MKAVTYSILLVLSVLLCGPARAASQASMSQVVMVPYTLQQGSATGAITGKASFTDTLSVVPTKSFAGTVDLTCTAPSGACALSQASVLFDGSGATQTVKVTYTAPVVAASGGLFVLSLFGLAGFGPRKRRIVSMTLGVLGLTLGLSGCGAVVKYPVDSATAGSMEVTATFKAYTPSVSYNITVTP